MPIKIVNKDIHNYTGMCDTDETNKILVQEHIQETKNEIIFHKGSVRLL